MQMSKENKRRSVKLIPIIFIIALIFVAVVIITKVKSPNGGLLSNNKSTGEQSKQVTEVSLEDDTVLEIINYITPINTSSEIINYQSKLVNEKNLGNKLKLFTIFHNLEEDDADSKETKKDENGNKKEHFYYSKETVEKMAKKIFGPDVQIKHESCEMYFGEAIDYKDGMYDKYEYEGGGATAYETSFSVLLRAEKDSENMYIYDKYAHIVEVTEEKNGETITLGYDIYDSSDKTNKVAEAVDFEKENIYAEDDEEELKNIEKYIGKELVTYKHTYKKAEDGSYYWVSTEQVK